MVKASSRKTPDARGNALIIWLYLRQTKQADLIAGAASLPASIMRPCHRTPRTGISP
jgi:hypothetical protein